MRIRQLNFDNASFFENAKDCLLFFKPLGSKLFRCNRLPSGLTPEKEKELREVLFTLNIFFHAVSGTWFFRMCDLYDEVEMMTIFEAMGISMWPVKLGADQSISN